MSSMAAGGSRGSRVGKIAYREPFAMTRNSRPRIHPLGTVNEVLIDRTFVTAEDPRREADAEHSAERATEKILCEEFQMSESPEKPKALMRSILVVSALSLLSACAGTTPPAPPATPKKVIIGLVGLNCPLGWYINVEGCTPEQGDLVLPPLAECPKGSSPLEEDDRVTCVFGSWLQRRAYIYRD
jgi:hypothetical protein